jgi:transcriptional antiterminator RfaH
LPEKREFLQRPNHAAKALFQWGRTGKLRPMSEDLKWYCLRTRPKQERMTSNLLRAEIGLEVFCPFIRFERAGHSGKRWVTEAMFPCYVFARFDHASQYRRVVSTGGVAKVVGFGGQPSMVDSAIISELRSAVADGETVEIQSPIRVGSEVCVVDGPFRGLRAIVTRLLPARQRVALLLELLGMEREVEIGHHFVLPDVPHPLTQND